MAWATVQSGQATSAAATVAKTLGGAPTNGNLLVAAVTANVTAVNVAMAAGGATWVAVDSGINANGNGISLRLFYKIAASESATITANATGATVMQMHVYEFSGDHASPLDVFTPVADSGSSVTSLLCTSPTLHQESELGFAAIAHSNTNGGSVTWTNSYAGGLTDTRLITAVLALSSSAATSTTGAWTTGRRACGYIAGFFSPITFAKNPRALLGVGV